MPSHKIHPRIFIAAILLAVVSTFGVVIVWNARSDNDSQHTFSPTAIPISDFYEPFQMTDVLVETNPMARYPVVVHVHGSLRDGCTRLRTTNVHYHEKDIQITIFAGYRNYWGTMCTQLTNPITLSIPLDTAILDPGDYILSVMGQTQTITIAPEVKSAAIPFSPEPTGFDVRKIEYVPSSDIAGQPAVRVSGNYSIDCPYLVGVEQQTSNHQITLTPHIVELRDDYCQQNRENLPEIMPLLIPLDLVNLSIGEYTLTLGDQTLSFILESSPAQIEFTPYTWPPPLTEPPADPFWLPVN